MSLRDIAKAREISAILERRLPPKVETSTEELAGNFEENKHPRESAGKFTSGSSNAKAAKASAKAVVKSATAKGGGSAGGSPSGGAPAPSAPAPSAPASSTGGFIIPKGTNTDNTAGQTVPVGLTSPGNINLHERPVVKNKDGSVSTVRSISIGTDQGEVLIPTVVGKKVVSDEEAIQHYKDTGEHLGIFDTPENASAYAETLHKEQDSEYAKDSPQIKANKDIQSKLNELGAKLDVDGRLGPKTKEAIKAAQEKLNQSGAKLKVDGIWGDKTEAAYKGQAAKGTVDSAKKDTVATKPGTKAPAPSAPKVVSKKPAAPAPNKPPVAAPSKEAPKAPAPPAPKPHGPNKKIVN